MTTQTKILTAVGLAAAVTVSGFFAYVAKAEMTDQLGPFAGRVVERLASLGVTDQQKAQIKAVLRKHQPAVEPLVQQFVAEKRELRDTIRADKLDERAICAQTAKVAQVGADLAVERARIVQELRPILTPEQIEKLKEMQADFDDRIDFVLHRIAKRIAED